MHKHKRYRHGPRHSHWPFFPGFFWIFIFMMMFSKGHWWPGILVIIGLWMVFGSLFKEDMQPPEPKIPPPPPFFDPVSPPFTPRQDSPPKETSYPKQTPTSAESIHRVDLLPNTCPRCGGPTRSGEVRWTGAQSAMCPYCGSNLPMKKG